jgi:hypothetical protein
MYSGLQSRDARGGDASISFGRERPWLLRLGSRGRVEGVMKRKTRAIVLGLALAGLQLAGACSSEKNCDEKASSIEACYACVGIKDQGATLSTPCKEFSFEQGKTCRCKPL